MSEDLPNRFKLKIEKIDTIYSVTKTEFIGIGVSATCYVIDWPNRSLPKEAPVYSEELMLKNLLNDTWRIVG